MHSQLQLSFLDLLLNIDQSAKIYPHKPATINHTVALEFTVHFLVIKIEKEIPEST